MPTPILMPALSPTMEVGTLAKWHVKKGDTVSSGDVVAEIETDKATMEVEAVDEGTVGEILVAEGTADVPVNQPIAVLLGDGESEADLPKSGANGNGAAAPAAAPPAPAASDGSGSPSEPDVVPQAPAAAPASTAPAPATINGSGGSRVFASPLARRIAAENAIDITRVSGSGPHGRIVKRDVEEALASGSASATETPAAAATPSIAPAGAPAVTPAAGMSDDQIRAMYAPGTYREIPHDGMRRTIARRLTESKQTVPHFYLTVDIELDALMALRAEINAAAPADQDGKPAYKLSVNDFVIKGLARALKSVPMANATFTPTARLVHEPVDVGVAVAIPDGLITPVIRNADAKSLSAISNEMKDLAARARDRKLKPEEYQGGTTAVSNLGMYGIRDFSAVINPPHGSILAVGAGTKRPVVRDDAVVAATVMTVTLSVDHRVIDGALGAELLAAFKPMMENPISLLV